MIKIFERGSNINFVDDNNVFVGYDYTQGCCEDFGYIVNDDYKSINRKNYNDFNNNYNLDSYNFDQSFVDFGGDCEFNTVIFKLVSETEPELYLTLYNYHNGYYSHGFEFIDKNTNKIITDGSI